MCYFFFTAMVVQKISGTFKQKKCYPAYAILLKLYTDILKNTLGIHGQAGCDTSSSFSVISKTKHIKSSIWKHRLPQSLRKSLSLFLPA